jgi:hypothetical protein
MSEYDFGKLGKVEVKVLDNEPFDIFAKYTSSTCGGYQSGGGPSSPFDDDGPCMMPLSP